MILINSNLPEALPRFTQIIEEVAVELVGDGVPAAQVRFISKSCLIAYLSTRNELSRVTLCAIRLSHTIAARTTPRAHLGLMVISTAAFGRGLSSRA